MPVDLCHSRDCGHRALVQPACQNIVTNRNKMALKRPWPWLWWSALSLLVGLLLVLAVAYSGLVNIAAKRGHSPWITWFLEMGMHQSVAYHSRRGPVAPPWSQAPLSLSAQAAIPLGAAHFHNGCATCHGASADAANTIYQYMLPAPPPLNSTAAQWRAPELHWLIDNGLQFTGMPAWAGAERGDEVWAVVAFLQARLTMSDATYQRLIHGNGPWPPRSDRPRPPALLTNCSRCHGHDRAAATSPWIPKLGGQSQDYLHRALLEYRADQRQSGFMETAAAALSDEQINTLAQWYAAVDEPTYLAPALTPSQLALYDAGRQLASAGDPSTELPPCQDCHGPSAHSAFPRLRGQPRAYLIQQLQVWQRGGRRSTPYGAMMAVVAQRMTPEQILATALFYEQAPAAGQEHHYP